MSSKLKVALSKVSSLPLLRELAHKHSALDSRTIAGNFYLKTLPKMTTMPKTVDSAPRVNLWLWLIGYLRVQWPEVQRNSNKFDAAKLRLLLKQIHKYLPERSSRQNSRLLKSVVEDTSIAHRTKKLEPR